MFSTKKIISAVCLSTCLLCSTFAAEKVSKPEKPYDPSAPYVMHNWGFEWARVTRIQLQSERSNFVWKDSLLGAYYAAQTGNLPLNLYLKLSFFYPYYYEFNQMVQKPKQVLLYGMSLNFGPIWRIPMWEAFYLDLAPVLDFRYQLSDSFNRLELGLGGMIGVELPVTKKFSILMNGMFSYDFGNLGSNTKSQPYNHVWAYTAQLGFRITNRGKNDFAYVKNTTEMDKFKERMNENAKKRAEKKAEAKKAADEKKSLKKQAWDNYKKEMQSYKDSKKKPAEKTSAPAEEKK